VGVVVGGVNVWVHDGPFGSFVQSAVGGVVPKVQFPASNVVPKLFPFPPDVGVDVLVGCIAADVLPGGVTVASAVVKLWAFWVGLGSSLAHFNTAILSFARSPADIHFVTAFSECLVEVSHSPIPLYCHLFYFNNFSDNSLSVISGQTNTVIGTPIAVGKGGPLGIAFDPANFNLYVANQNDNTVSVIATTPQ
jgi:hypothetical protein